MCSYLPALAAGGTNFANTISNAAAKSATEAYALDLTVPKECESERYIHRDSDRDDG